ncbi:hypothetical protein COLO4_32001 [Corchorus olitorius]|uniref:HMA domain-containing protein n=1 Tax=Corchorus olitorius TaxID=93759 RepID=A0A1R3H2H2_9ROSI|nr:hypothetical protein COLO4_32001 [Corchorus olitorius]
MAVSSWTTTTKFSSVYHFPQLPPVSSTLPPSLSFQGRGNGINLGSFQEVEQLLGPEEKAILQQNATPNLSKISTAKWKPLQTLALSLQIPFMDKLLEDGLDIDETDEDGHTALHKAIIGKKEAVISHLLRKGANPHVIDKDGATPLHYAVHVGAMQTVKLLLKYNVDANVADRDGWTPLHIAVQSRNRDIVKVLLINGADKTRKTKESVSVPVSPSDTLKMYFQADGTLNEAEIPKVAKALEEAEGISDVKVQVIEGIGTVELTKQTTVQSTGVASSLVEIIQGAGFKLQTLNLSFDDEEEILV